MIVGNSHTCQVEGIDSVSIKLFDGMVRILKDVRYVPSLSRNLISFGILDHLGFVITIEYGTMKICKGSMIVLKGTKKNGLYNLIGETLIGNSTLAIAVEDQKAIV